MEHFVDRTVKFLKTSLEIDKIDIAVIASVSYEVFTEKIENKKEIRFADIPDMKLFGADAIENRFVYGTLAGKKVLFSVGRLHYNNGYSCSDIANFIFILKELGAQRLVISACVGVGSKHTHVGDIVTAVDHINLTGRNALFGCDYNRYGSLFIDLDSCYDKDMIKVLSDTARSELKLKVKKGVLVEFSGPSVETLSESKLAKQIGGDFAGFNVVNEVISANYCSLPVIMLGLATNYAVLYSAGRLKHEDVDYNRNLAKGYYLELLERFINNI
jgi:purine-nucleoside phosphorylase